MSRSTTRGRAALAALGLAAASSAGCPLVQVEAEIEQVCVTRAGVEVAAAGGAGRAVVRTTTTDLAAARDLLDPRDEVRFVRFSARAGGGVTSLGFLRAARVHVASADPTSPLPQLLVFECGAECVTAEGGYQAPAVTEANAVDYALADELAFELELEGALPERAWSLDAEVCLSGRVVRSYSP